ncbi:unnamed protein product [Calicophoron daubneyi]|uniref:Caspase-3 n=1 Tax=Calicophoron daubneyi TaxID=300641 RepID=A0AAV2TXK7_CALDB
MNRLPSDFAAIPSVHSGAYNVSCLPRGYVLLINIEKYRFSPERHGSSLDEHRLQRMFEAFNYKVLVHRDLGASEFRHKIREFASRKEHQFMDSTVVVILAHGLEGEIEACDGEFLRLNEDILECFSAGNCEQLKGKPKLFIIQACRGKKTDGGKVFNSSEHQDLAVDASSSTPKFQSSQPSFADFIIAYPTTYGYASWRIKDKGAPFIRKLVEVFRREANTKHVEDMLKIVNDELSEGPVYQEYYQCSQIESTLRKPFFLWTDDLKL